MKLLPENIDYIKNAFDKMQSNEAFIELLNFVNNLIYGNKAFNFTLNDINQLSISKVKSANYRQFIIRKKNGENRIIHTPSKKLKAIQKSISIVFQTISYVHPSATGFQQGTSIVDNAKRHVGKNYVYNLDLKDFFSTIEQNAVFQRLQALPFNLNNENSRLHLATLIATLCCQEINVSRLENGEWQKLNKSVLPQGAPTSPIISNFICNTLDINLAALAKSSGLIYSRYADDITFSSSHNVYRKDSDFLRELRRTISKEGFHINERKNRLLKNEYKQVVTGLIVNKKVNVPSRYVKNIRLWLYLWEHYDYEKASEYFIPHYLKDRRNIREKPAQMDIVIDGKLNFLKMVKGETSNTYRKLKERFEKLKATKSFDKQNEIPKANFIEQDFGDDLPPTQEGQESTLFAYGAIDDNLLNRVNKFNEKVFKPISNPVHEFDAETANNRTSNPKIFFSPSTIDMKTMSEEEKQKLIETVKKLIEKFPNAISFEEFVKALVDTYGEANVEDIFNTLKEGWKLNGKELTETQANLAYTKIFANPLDILKEITDINQIEQEESKNKTATEINKAAAELENAEAPITVDTNNQPVKVQYDGPVTNSPIPYLVLENREYNFTRTVDENGVVTLNYSNKGNLELNANPHIDSRDLYHPDKYLEEDKLTLKSPTNVDEVVITVFNEDGTKDKNITWGEWKAENPHLSPDTQEYQDKIPIIAYAPDAKEGDKGLASIHDVQWYSPENFLNIAPEEMKEAIANTRKIRKAVLESKDGSTSITITEKRPSTFSPFIQPNVGTRENPKYEFLKFSEANPEAIFVVANGVDSFYDRDNFKFNNDTDILLKSDKFSYVDGRVYEIRRAGWKNGKKAWYVFPVTPQGISKEAKTTIAQAIDVFINANSPNPEMVARSEKIAKEIEQVTGLNILRAGDLREYLNTFTKVHGDSKGSFARANNYIQMDAIANTHLKNAKNESLGYIVIPNSSSQKNVGVIYIGATNWNIAPELQTIFLNTGTYDYHKANKFIANLNKKYIIRRGSPNISIIDSLAEHYSLQVAKNNKPVVMIDTDGNVKTVAASYQEYQIQTLATNVKSINVAKENEAPVYATASQKISFKLSDEAGIKTEATDKDVVVTNVDNMEQEAIEANKKLSHEEELKKKVEEILKQAEIDLGIDFNSDVDVDDMA